MRRALALGQQLLLLVGLLAALAPAELSCCAGLTAGHGADCCTAELREAMARACCEGGEDYANTGAGAPSLPAAAVAGSAIPPLLRSSLEGSDVAAAARGPTPRPLYTLHASLLL